MPAGARPTRAESEASEWLVLLDSNVVPRHEIERFQAWLAASDENKKAWDAVGKTWDRLGPMLAALPQASLTAGAARAGPLRAAFAARPVVWAGAGAIAAALGALALLAPLPAPPASPDSASYAVQLGQTERVSLEDGSMIELGPLARVSVAYSAEERRVSLDEGAALFEVAADAARPFIVVTPYGEVRAVGTAFVVRVGEDGATASVVRGVVEGSAAQGRTLLARLGPSPAAVTAHAQDEIRLSRDSAALSQLAAGEIEQRLAWRDGKVAGDNITLAEAAAEMSRFSGVVFTFEDDALAEERVSLYVDGSDVEGFVALVEANFGAVASRRTDGVIAIRRAP